MAKKLKINDFIEELFEENKIKEFSEYELVHSEFVKEGKEKFLRLYIDKEEGISHDDCELVSRKISECIDEIDLIKEAYILEVSSPGIERPLKKLKDFERFLGRRAEIKLYAAMNGRKSFIGDLESVENENIMIKLEENDESVSIPFEKVSSAKLVYIFE